MTRQEFLSPEQIRKHSIYTGVFEREVEWTLTVQTGITLPSGAKGKHRRSRGALGLRRSTFTWPARGPCITTTVWTFQAEATMRRSPIDEKATSTS